MTKIRKNLFKIQPQSREITSQISIIFRLPPFHLKQERKWVYALWQNHMGYFTTVLLEMLGVFHSFMSRYFNPKLQTEAIAI